jgi:hypothetical protein
MVTSGSLVLIAIVPMVLAGTAFAQVADPALGAPDSTAGAAATPAIAADAPGRYPRSIFARPMTYPEGLAGAGFDLTSMTSSLAGPATGRLLAGYGITDDLEVIFGYDRFPTNAMGKGSVELGAGYMLLRGALDDKLEVIARAQSSYSLASSDLGPLLAGVQAGYAVTPSLVVLTPGGQLSVGLAGDRKPVTFGLPVSVGWQASSTVFFLLDTQLATFELAHATTSYMVVDSTPVAVTGFVNALPAVDLFAGVSANLTPPDTMDATGTAVKTGIGATLSVMLGARYYLGKL